jgi:transposase-like protein
VGYERHGTACGNPRNGTSHKTVQRTVGALQIETLRDQEGTFKPRLLPKRRVRLAGVD